MRILLIRHGDPDYSTDSLTPKGKQEAAFLAERLAQMQIDSVYVSPLGRAVETVDAYLSKSNQVAVTVDDFQEFIHPCVMPDTGEHLQFPWGFTPAYWTNEEGFYHLDDWKFHPIMLSGDIGIHYDRVCKSLDKVLAEHGYVRDKRIYYVERSNHDTIAVFCHLGTIGVILSHLLGIPPVILWHGISAPTSSVTVLYSEERIKGEAFFRCQSLGDISHLFAHNMDPSFCCRYCEVFEDDDQR